jgi:hypothetical protein
MTACVLCHQCCQCWHHICGLYRPGVHTLALAPPPVHQHHVSTPTMHPFMLEVRTLATSIRETSCRLPSAAARHTAWTVAGTHVRTTDASSICNISKHHKWSRLVGRNCTACARSSLKASRSNAYLICSSWFQNLHTSLNQRQATGRHPYAHSNCVQSTDLRTNLPVT